MTDAKAALAAPEIINIYIDGSCIHNGSPNAIAGYGVYFKNNDSRNEYARVIGKQTNNTGELTAFIRAVEIMNEELNRPQSNSKINIYTDSEYVIKCAGTYGAKLSKNDWKTSTGKVPPNLKLIQRIEEIYKPFKKRISLQHVKAHTGLDDEHSLGNAEADRLANLAVGVVAVAASSDCLDDTLISNIKESVTYSKHYINIKYEFKDAINISYANKKAIQDIEVMSESNTKTEDTIATETGVEIEIHKKIYVKIPFKNKDAVKKLGCRWEPEKKSWYYMSDLEKNKIDAIKKLEA